MASRYGSKTRVSTATTSWQPIVSAVTPTVEYLIIGGGACGGSGSNADVRSGGGGGAGGYRSNINTEMSGGGNTQEAVMTVSTGINYTVTVGAGGASTIFPGCLNRVGPSGSASSWGPTGSVLTANGGGGGGQPGSVTGIGGGSGGGGAANNGGGGGGTAQQGYAGGTANTQYGGGGGGAGSAGVLITAGAGVTSSVTGSAVVRAQGGSGGAGGSPTPGAANTGNGGTGGTGYYGSYAYCAGAGGSGVVIIRYPSGYKELDSIGAGLSYTRTIVGDYQVYTFTAGTGTVTF